MSLVRVGLSSKKFSAGYDAIFSKKKAEKPAAKKKKPTKKKRG